jgi:hypothetical protein
MYVNCATSRLGLAMAELVVGTDILRWRHLVLVHKVDRRAVGDKLSKHPDASGQPTPRWHLLKRELFREKVQQTDQVLNSKKFRVWHSWVVPRKFGKLKCDDKGVCSVCVCVCVCARLKCASAFVNGVEAERKTHERRSCSDLCAGVAAIDHARSRSEVLRSGRVQQTQDQPIG